MRPLFTVIKNTLLCGLILLSVSSYGNVFIVDNAANTDNLAVYTAADGTNTLRKCIRLANGNVGKDNINFNLPGVGPYIVSVATTTLAITDTVIIDGYTQLGASAGNLLVQLNCSTGGIDILQLNAGSTGSIIRGLVIYGNNASTGIKINTSNNHVISGNYIGTNLAGTATVAGSILQIGISLINATNCTIGGTGGVLTRNIVSGNSQKGIYIQATSTGTVVQGNYIGVNATGNTALANTGSGVEINSFNTQTIGGLSYSARNVISGNQNGINVFTCNALIVKGNFIGLGADGKTVIPNTQQGINLQNPTSATTIGGLTLPERNIISGNQYGIQAANATGITIQNNYIGTDSTGLLAKGNSQSGINFMTATNTNVLIGGTTYSARNIISGNTSNGISIINCTTLTIKGNFIGLGADGTTAIPNGQSGINLGNPTTSVIIGGLSLPERNVIASSTNNYGINVSTNSGITIQNNYIGTDSTGLLARGNKGGISIATGTSVLIGGTTYSARNLICSSTGNQGIFLNSISTSVVIQGNFIGLAVNGTTAFGNTNNGIQIQNSPTATVTLGGPTKPERNVISSNTTGSALLINGTGSASATIQNNYIGTDSTGMFARGNQSGINISATPTILIGGTSYSLRNIVSASTGSLGIMISGCSTSVVIKGNIIGLSGNGTSSSDVNGVTFSNLSNGITVQSSPNATVTLGGSTNPERNVISNNKATAMLINGALSATIQNNYIGTDSTGMFARGNQAGINISATPTILIGGTSYSTRNIISASTGSDGITIIGCSTSVVIKSNIIGLAMDGIKALDVAVPFGNKSNGITIQSSPNATITIGGITIPERNIISSNLSTGLLINGSLSATIQNNYIGIDSTGMLARGNQTGINIATTPTILIGGTSYSARNIVSASTGNVGITISSSSTSIVIKSNIIGLAVDGITPSDINGVKFGNANNGISIYSSPSASLTVGGITPPERNIISSNLQTGLYINQCASATIQNNYIGTDSTGLLNRGNGNNGIDANVCAGLLIGGTVYGARNLVCGSVGNGIAINAGCPGAIIKANFCGIGKDGITVISNQGSGIYFGGSNSNAAIIGGSNFVERNVSSGNGTTPNAYFYSRDGIRIEGGSTNHVIKGNYCGVDSTGTIPLGNVWAGISINEGTDCIVGGTGTYEGNISGDNKDEGVYFRNALRITFIGNFVGTDKTGTIDLGNGDYGVNIRLASTDNVIGGASIADQNYIAYTKGNLAGSGPGVYVDTMSTRNKIVRNKIYCNATQGIVLVNSSANEGIAAPVILTSLTNSVNGTGSINGDSIHVYLNIKSGGNCDCEGETFVGGTIVSGGAWSLTHNLMLSTAQEGRITATETTVNNSTSEFSTCLDPLPVSLISFDAKKQADHTVLVEWSTANEQNNKDFEVQRSTDGVHFQTIEIVAGSGNSTGIKNYSIIDTNAPDGIVYYKLKQVDINGTSTYSKIASVDFSLGKLSVIQNNDGFTIVVPGDKNNVTYQVYSITGALVAQGSFSPSGTQQSFKVNLVLAPAMYMVSAAQGNSFETQKIIVSE
jgi:hypothetical protein